MYLFIFFSIRALKGAKGEDTEISAPVGICVTRDDGKTLGNFTQRLYDFITRNVVSVALQQTLLAFAIPKAVRVIRVRGHFLLLNVK